ncbi:asparagine synthase-related protein [Sphingopyxis alaskensis]|uniref:asparagine synthase-related protein n=1 Tax=Sphingopyxis alaskensis TaxID=117207 RepID=UPI00203AB115|nr:asparagine synthase-related protein [Sphingopyxis alaskensis]
MSARYALIVGRLPSPPPDRVAAVPTTTWKQVFETNGIVVLVENVRALLLASRSGILIGDIFRRQGPPQPISEIDVRTEAGLIDGKLDALLSSYWGSYVGVIDVMGGPVVFRDPSAACPCYFTETAESVIFASDVRTLIEFGRLDATIDWDGVAEYLYSFGLPSTKTALTNVSELLPGTSVKVRETSLDHRQIWSPWDYVSDRPVPPIALNAEALRETVHSCTAALTHKIVRPLISVSGGLDSSVVAACVSGSGRAPVGLTMFTHDPAGDERHYSSILCDAFGYELVSCKYLSGEIRIDEPASPHLPRPVGRTLAMAYENALLKHAAQRNVDGFLTGNGGDNVFANLRSAKPIIDRYIAEGWRRELWSTFRDIADLTGTSYWQVGKAAFKAFRSRHDRYCWKASTRFLHPDLLAVHEAKPLDHEWLNGPDTALPGQRVHIAGILRVQQTLEPPRAAYAPVINPLIAQPVIELCLSIPTWQWCAGGRDRAVARMAFNSDLPAAILDRRVKGTPDGFSAQIIDHYRDEIRERLLDGYLAQRGLLDRSCLEAVLARGPISRAEDRPRLLDLLDTEAWIAHWLGDAGADRAARRSASLRSSSQ